MNVTEPNLNTSSPAGGGFETVNNIGGCLDKATLKAIAVSFMSVFVLPTLFGNTLIIICYVKYKYFHGISMYKYVVNLALSDIFVGLTMLLYSLPAIFPELKFYKYFCLTRTTLVLIAVSSSVCFLTWISIDRFLAIVFPLRHRVKSRNKRRIWIVIIITWIISVADGCSLYVNNGLDSFGNYDTNMPCLSSAIIPEMFSVWMDFTLIFVLCVDFILYIFILRTIYKSTATKQSGKGAFRKTKLMFIVYVTFFICWIPLIISNIIYFHSEEKPESLLCVRDYLFMLGVARACTNWIFYGIWNKQFRQGFRSILCCSSKHTRNSTLRSSPPT